MVSDALVDSGYVVLTVLWNLIVVAADRTTHYLQCLKSVPLLESTRPTSLSIPIGYSFDMCDWLMSVAWYSLGKLEENFGWRLWANSPMSLHFSPNSTIPTLPSTAKINPLSYL